MNPLIFVRKSCIPNFRPLVPFLHVKKFVVVGGWMGVKIWILVLSFKPKLNKTYYWGNMASFRLAHSRGILLYHLVAPSCKLKLAKFSA